MPAASVLGMNAADLVDDPIHRTSAVSTTLDTDDGYIANAGLSAASREKKSAVPLSSSSLSSIALLLTVADRLFSTNPTDEAGLAVLVGSTAGFCEWADRGSDVFDFIVAAAFDRLWGMRDVRLVTCSGGGKDDSKLLLCCVHTNTLWWFHLLTFRWKYPPSWMTFY